MSESGSESSQSDIILNVFIDTQNDSSIQQIELTELTQTTGCQFALLQTEENSSSYKSLIEDEIDYSKPCQFCNKLHKQGNEECETIPTKCESCDQWGCEFCQDWSHGAFANGEQLYVPSSIHCYEYCGHYDKEIFFQYFIYERKQRMKLIKQVQQLSQQHENSQSFVQQYQRELIQYESIIKQQQKQIQHLQEQIQSQKDIINYQQNTIDYLKKQ